MYMYFHTLASFIVFSPWVFSFIYLFLVMQRKIKCENVLTAYWSDVSTAGTRRYKENLYRGIYGSLIGCELGFIYIFIFIIIKTHHS